MFEKGDRFKFKINNEKGVILQRIGTYNNTRHYFVKMENDKYPDVITISGDMIEMIKE